MLTVHVRINDAATGKATPCRVRFLDADGNAHVPFGRLSDFATGPGEDLGGNLQLGSERWSYIDGACEVRLPAAAITIEARKGPEYSPLRRTVTLGPGQISLRLNLERWTDLRAEGWHAGDTRSHFLSPPAALLEGAAEDLGVVNVLAQEVTGREGKPTAMADLLAFSGDKPALESAGHLVAVNTLNAHSVLGTVSLLHSHRPVFPLRFGMPGGLDDWSVADWCDQCHRKKGLVVWTDLPRLTEEHPQGETLAALLLGKIDAWEVCGFSEPEPRELADYYRLLDCGLRLPLVGGSGKDRNSIALGAVRTYAQLRKDEPLTYSAWIEAIRAGRTFVTNGPLISLMVEGQGPGSGVTRSARGGSVRMHAEAHSVTPFEQVEILGNGKVLASKTASGNRQATVLEAEVELHESAWLTARCWGRDHVLGGAAGQVVFAHTSPIYFDAGGTVARPGKVAVELLSALLDRTLNWVRREARCEAEKQRRHLEEVLLAGRRELERWGDGAGTSP